MNKLKKYKPVDPDFKKKVQDSFYRQPFMELIGAELTKIEPGECEISLPFQPGLTQQHGYFHAGVIGTLADNGAGYAAFSLMAKDASVLTIEYKLNLVSPGTGDSLLGCSQVLRHGKTITVCRSDVFGVSGDQRKLCATALVTIMTMAGMKDSK